MSTENTTLSAPQCQHEDTEEIQTGVCNRPSVIVSCKNCFANLGAPDWYKKKNPKESTLPHPMTSEPLSPTASKCIYILNGTAIDKDVGVALYKYLANSNPRITKTAVVNAALKSFLPAL